MKKILGVCAWLAIAFAACGKEQSSESKSKDQLDSRATQYELKQIPTSVDGKSVLTLQYHYKEKRNNESCDTGLHKFEGDPVKAKKSYCEALKNEELNNRCAYSARMKTYSMTCGENSLAYAEKLNSPSRPGVITLDMQLPDEDKDMAEAQKHLRILEEQARDLERRSKEMDRRLLDPTF